MNTSRERVAELVIECVKSALGAPADEPIGLESRLVTDLGAESMDFMDIVSRIGRRLQVELRLEQLDDELKGAMTEAEFEQGLLTPAALEILRRYFPHAGPDELHDGMALHEIPFLMTVETLVDFSMASLQRAGSP
jgi:acyl carrier protein